MTRTPKRIRTDARVIPGILPILVLTSALWPRDAIPSAPPAPPPADVLLIHDSLPGPLPSGTVVGNNILDLLGHFNLTGTLIPIEEYKTGEVNRHRFVIVLGVDDRDPRYPANLLADIRNTSVPVFWILRHLDELLTDPQMVSKLGFRPRPGVLDGYQSVTYQGISLLKNDPLLLPLEILDAAKVQVVATAGAPGKKSQPFVVRAGSFWYCADSPFSYTVEGDRYLAFCDLLHDFFKIPHQQERKALLRIEDVSVDDDPDQLRELADYLYDRHIPFQVSFYPIFRDPATNEEIYLTDRPQFARLVRYMVSKGALIVLHGVTHQYRGRSGDDYEFWDAYSDKPVQGDSQALVEQRLRLGLEECFKNGIYPVTWETPHYMASEVDYRTIARSDG